MAPVRYPDLIAKKRDGQELSDEEIQMFVQGVAKEDMGDSQIGAMLMAIFLRGMSTREVTTLTQEMVNSGECLTWPEEWKDILVDKHSTGGVGDKISLVLMPALAAVGMKVPTISGRGLAHTGGTLDKLEAIPGFRVSLTSQEMTHMLRTVGVFIAGQTQNICPADKIMYKTRDVTATVNHIGLITGSIMSKKLAESIKSLVLDVKTGNGALMADEQQAAELAESMVSCGKGLGLNSVALITDMDSPIGNMVGNALEVAESIWCLQGKGPSDLEDLVVEQGGQLLAASGKADSVEEGTDKLRQSIRNGTALGVFREMMKGQGVSSDVADDLCDPQKDVWTILTPAKNKTELKSPTAGYVKRIDAMPVAVAVHRLGGGRTTPGASINWSVGVQLLADIGSQLDQGQAWAVIHHDENIPDDVLSMLENALKLSSEKVPPVSSRVKRVISK
ncbi:thymidine phosphorylase [Aplysia californica]|uniref:Thymidine phosphorylase n=1 Tax=Aplysia californica TaxID=6500 RepID=A0ABM1A9M0_APLCA|nr:thymidine phosphorylase [Aplysia californica]